MLNALQFKLTIPTIYVFLQRFLKLAKASVDVSMLSQYLAELALVDYNMLKFPCSRIAAAAVYIASNSICMSECSNYARARANYILQQQTLYNVEDISRCIL